MRKARILGAVLLLAPAALRAQSFCEAVAPETLVNPTVLGDGSPGSVTTAQIQAALDAGGSIRFDMGPNPTTITLGATLRVNRGVVLDGGGVVTLSGGGARRILEITNTLDLTYAVTLQNIGFANASTPTGRGAAIFKQSGGRWQQVSLKLVNCTFQGNAAMATGQDDGGGALYATGLDHVRIGNCTFTGNTGSNGGAVYSLGSKRVTIVDSVFTGNQATGTGGNPGNGGNAGAVGIDGEVRQVDVCRTRFVSNTSNAFGAGFFTVMYDAASRTRFEDTTFDGNRQLSASAHAGGAYVQGGPFAFERVSFLRNEANGYGGLFVGPGASGTIRNATFVANVARQGLGAALAVNAGAPVSIVNTTIARNVSTAAFAAGISVGSPNQLRLTNVILAHNTGGNVWVNWNIQNAAAQDGGGNMQWPAARPSGGGAETPATPSTVFADPLLAAAAADNGGAVPTLAVATASPARDTGVATAEVPPTDARGRSRVGAPDRGSFEIDPPAIAVGDATATEGGYGSAPVTFTVGLSRASPDPVTVQYTTANGTAAAGSDYGPASGTLTFPAGTVTVPVAVSVLGDLVDEPDETFTLQLSSPANATLADATGQGTILDDDPPPQVVVEDCAAVEGSAATTPCSFRLALSGPSSSTVTVAYATANGTAVAGIGGDYEATSGTVTFTSLATGPQTVGVFVRGDASVEPDETFFLNLASPVGATLPDPQGLGVVLDDDAPSLSAHELSHGSADLASLAARPGPVADQDLHRLAQRPYSSYEVVVDATSGDIGPGLLVERLAADNATVLQTAQPVGTGHSMSLRFENTLPQEVTSQHLRVRSNGCTTTCGPDDVYRIRAYDTTYTIARFNNSATQTCVLVVQNPTSATVTGHAYFWSATGHLLHVRALALPPHAVTTSSTASIPALGGTSGAVTVASDAPYGVLAGKIVALEPATGFSFDSVMEPRPRP